MVPMSCNCMTALNLWQQAWVHAVRKAVCNHEYPARKFQFIPILEFLGILYCTMCIYVYCSILSWSLLTKKGGFFGHSWAGERGGIDCTNHRQKDLPDQHRHLPALALLLVGLGKVRHSWRDDSHPKKMQKNAGEAIPTAGIHWLVDRWRKNDREAIPRSKLSVFDMRQTSVEEQLYSVSRTPPDV